MEQQHKQYPRVGIGVMVNQKGKLLLGKRKGNHGQGTWGFPGGHLEFNETWQQAAQREVMEETGISIKNVKFAAASNDIFKETKKHYVTIFVTAEIDAGESEVCEPDKCERWEWFAWHEMPKPLFLSIENLLLSGYEPFIR